MLQRVLISGAGIAGQVTAFWLARAGWDVTVVERSGSLRTSGQNVDIRGVAREVIMQMGLSDEVAGRGTGEVGTRFVDARNRCLAEFPEDGTAGGGATAEWEILRSQLAGLLLTATREKVRYRFGVSIERIDQDPTRVAVSLDDGRDEDYDAVVVAEGIRSRTRDTLSPAFGVVDQRLLGVTIGYFSIPRTDSDDQWWRWFNAPDGRAVTLRPDNLGRTRATLSFRDDGRSARHADRAHAGSVDLLRRVFAGAGWETTRIVEALDDVDDLYLDQIGQVLAERWSSGRVAVVGDAAYCPSPVSGMGTSLAIVGGYVLAGELATHESVSAAFASYEAIMRPYVTRAQRLPPGAPLVMHPKSTLGVAVLQTAFRLAGSGVLRPFERRLFHPPADTMSLPAYPNLAVDPTPPSPPRS